MGRRLDQLNLGDSGPDPTDDLKESRRDATIFAAELAEMAEDEKYSFCWGMLVDMRLTVEQTERVSDAQRQAIENVKEGAERHERQREGWDRHQKRTGRRYEGWWPGDR